MMNQNGRLSPTCVPKLAAIMCVSSLAANMEYLAQNMCETTAKKRPVKTKDLS